MITAMTSLKKTMVIGRNFSLATLNHTKENAQKIIARKIAPYILIRFFNWLLIYF